MIPRYDHPSIRITPGAILMREFSEGEYVRVADVEAALKSEVAAAKHCAREYRYQITDVIDSIAAALGIDLDAPATEGK